MRLLHTNTVNQTVNPISNNNSLGFTAFVRDSDSKIIYFPIREDGSIVVADGEQDAGLTYLFTSIKAVNKLLNCDVKIVLPEHGALTAQEIIDNVDRNSTLYCNELKDGNGTTIALKDISDLLAPQTGNCFNKTAAFYNLLQYALKDSSGEYIKDSNGEFIIAKDW